MRFLVQLSDTSSELPLAALNQLVSESVDVVVHCARVHGRVGVSEIVAIEDLQGGAEATTFTTSVLFERSADGELKRTGNLPSRATRALTNVGYELRVGSTKSTEVH